MLPIDGDNALSGRKTSVKRWAIPDNGSNGSVRHELHTQRSVEIRDARFGFVLNEHVRGGRVVGQLPASASKSGDGISAFMRK